MKRDALVVGINQYPFLKDTPTSKAKHLKTPAGDAEVIAQLLETYGEFEVQRLPATNRDGKLQVDPQKLVTIKDLQKAITELFQPSSQQVPETAVLFFTGHGLRQIQGGCSEGYLGTSDANPRKDVWGISLQWLRQLLQESSVRQQIIWLDCCHSGEFLNFIESDLGEYEKGRDRCFIVASRDFQVAYEAAEGDHGVLSGALLQGLDPTRQPEKWVTNYSLVDFVKQALKDAPQHPICTNSGGQIILTGEQSVISSTCPYKGLAYFDFNEEDPKYFYGRTALANQLLEKVRQNNFLAVLGASGSGKSSVVRAGLLYQLKLGEVIPGSERWKIYPPFTPGDRPLQRLKAIVGIKAEQLEPLLKAIPTERVVLVVDQFEEAFTLCRDDGERQQFFECLMTAVKCLGNKLCLVLAMRADFFGKCAEKEYAGLAKAIEQNLVTVLPMRQEELREAITKPAEQVGLKIERELVTQMIADVEGSPGNLPLLQYTLTELWERKSLNQLMLSEYTRLGGIKEALEKQANKVYDFFSTEEQKAAKLIFLELTQLGKDTEDTRKQVRQEDLVNSQQSQELVEQLIQKLADAKLIVTSQQELEQKRVAVVNIVHEALIRNWDLFGKWLRENRSALLRKQDIEDAAKEWRDKGKPKDSAYLLQGKKLVEAEIFHHNYGKKLPLSSVGEEFFKDSIKERKKRRHRTVSIVTTVILGLSGLTSWALIENENNQIRALNASSEALLLSNNELEALIQALKAGGRLKAPLGAIVAKANTRTQTVATLQQAVYRVREHNRLYGLAIPNTTVHYVSFSPDGQIIARSDDDTVKLWKRNGTLIKTFEGMGRRVTFSPDGQTMATIDGNLVKLWSINGTLLTTLKSHSADVWGVSFSPDGQIVVTSDSDNTAKLWNRNGNLLKTLKHTNNVDNLTAIHKIVSVEGFSPNGEIFATTGSNTIKMWSRNGTLLKTLKNAGQPVSFSPDGQIIASAYGENKMKLWSRNGALFQIIDASHGGKPLDFLSHIIFSPDSQMIATAGGNTVKIWNRNGILLKTFKGHNSKVEALSFSPDGQTITSVTTDGTVKIWSFEGIPIKNIKAHQKRIDTINFSPDGQLIATSGVDAASTSVVKIWSINGNLIINLDNHVSNLTDSVSFSPDSKTIASASDGKAVKLRGRDGSLLKILHHENPVQSVSFSPDGQLIVSASGNPGSTSGNKTVKLWKRDGTLMKILENLGYQATISPDGKIIATVNANTVKLWDINGNLLQILRGHNNTVNNVTFSADSKIIASASNDKSIRLWYRDGSLIKTIEGQSEVDIVSFSSDGKLLALAYSNGIVDLLNFNLDDLIESSCDWLRDYLKHNDTNHLKENICKVPHLHLDKIPNNPQTLIPKNKLPKPSPLDNARSKISQTNLLTWTKFKQATEISANYDLPDEFKEGFVYYMYGPNWLGAYVFKKDFIQKNGDFIIKSVSDESQIDISELNQFQLDILNQNVTTGAAIYFHWGLGFSSLKDMEDTEVKFSDDGGCFQAVCLKAPFLSQSEIIHILRSSKSAK